jgi:hypothetical protein
VLDIGTAKFDQCVIQGSAKAGRLGHFFVLGRLSDLNSPALAQQNRGPANSDRLGRSDIYKLEIVAQAKILARAKIMARTKIMTKAKIMIKAKIMVRAK